jgi:hypothetical protein
MPSSMHILILITKKNKSTCVQKQSLVFDDTLLSLMALSSVREESKTDPTLCFFFLIESQFSVVIRIIQNVVNLVHDDDDDD